MATPFRSFAEFSDAIHVLSGEASGQLRDRFVEHRVDHAHAKMQAGLRLRQFADGLAYAGYLWDYLIDKRPLSEPELWQALAEIPDLYAMGDIHSSELVRVQRDFLLPKGAVVHAEVQTLRAGLNFLPEDLYLFDESCAWAAVLTHEELGEGRFCVWSGGAPTISRPGADAQPLDQHR
jgi:hypothetical protein